MLRRRLRGRRPSSSRGSENRAEGGAETGRAGEGDGHGGRASRHRGTDSLTRGLPETVAARSGHSQSSPCLRQSLSVIPLPHTASQGQSPVSHSHSASSPYIRNTLTVIPLPQKITHRHPPASHSHTAVTPTLGRLPWCCVCILFILLFYSHTLTHSHAPASQVTHIHASASHSYEFGGLWAFFGSRDSALGFMSLRAPVRDRPTSLMVIPLPHKSLIVIPLPHTVTSLGDGGLFLDPGIQLWGS